MISGNTFAVNDAVIHYFTHSPSVDISSFNEALNTNLWRGNFKPFAYAITHKHANEVILVRDHLGIEPLYYYHQVGKKLIFAQTIPAILKQLPSTPPLLDNQIDMLFSEHKFYSAETLYKGIYRVEPGHLMHFKANGTIEKKIFWQLERQGPMLDYKDSQDYLDHFTMLMNESIINATENHTNIAAEFSAGLDSSAVYCAAADINIRPKLYMHIAKSETKAASTYNDIYEKAFINHYQLNEIQRIGADDFDPIQVFNEQAAWFAGPAPYLFFMFANPVHRAVADGKHPILLSGFGGDQCVSGQIPLNFFLPELLNQGEYREAWGALKARGKMKRVLQLIKYMHPSLYAQALRIKRMKGHVLNTLRPKSSEQSTLLHPYELMYYPSLREAECALLQGANCHEVRMRIEYSSVVSKQLGFEYRYPLLYPKLLEFMLCVPTRQKRNGGIGRNLLRQYLSQFLPGDDFSTYRKSEGMGIVPSTFDFFQHHFDQGDYTQEFRELPYKQKIKHKHAPIELRNNIKAYMLKVGAIYQ